jgi:hypothetical protein
MNQLCRYLQRLKNLEIWVSDILGEGIHKSKLYISKACKIDFPESSNEWNEIQKLNQIRNCITHCEGNISIANSPDKLKNIINETNGLKLSPENEIIIDLSYLENIISKIEKFTDDLYDKAFE